MKDIGRNYKHIQYQLSNPSIKEPVLSSSYFQTSSYTKLKITSVSSVIDKKQTNSVLCSQNTIQNDLNITNNDDMQSCETPIKQNYIIPTTSTPNHHAQCIDDMSVRLFNLYTTKKLPPVGK